MDENSTADAADKLPPLFLPADVEPVATSSDRGGPTAAAADASEGALQTQTFDDFSSMQRLPPQTTATRCVSIKVINHSRRVQVFADVCSSSKSPQPPLMGHQRGAGKRGM
jgi:hypothetical protein